MLDVTGLKTYFYSVEGEVKAVDDVSFSVERGKIVALIGESGCGKSTIARSIMRLVPPPGKIVGGKINFNGNDILTYSESQMERVRGKEIAMIFQDPLTYLNPVMKVGEQVAEAILNNTNVTKEGAMKKVIDLFHMVGLPESARLLSYYPHQLSGGMRQRVVIATAISCSPKLLIADEPTSALDVTIQTQILDLLQELTTQLSAPLLLITHDLGIVAEIADEVNVMYAGKIVEQGDVYEIFKKPKHPYTIGLQESVLRPDMRKSTFPYIPGRVPNLIKPPTGCRFAPRCPHVMDVCREREPAPMHLTATHSSACWLNEREKGSDKK